MRLSILSLACLSMGCSSSPEPVEHSSQSYIPDCKIVGQFTDLTTCSTKIYSKCADGSLYEYNQVALAANYIGQWCMIENGQTYYYVCGNDSKGQAWVFCDKGQTQ